MAAEIQLRRPPARRVAVAKASRNAAPEAIRRAVKLAASMLPAPSASRHRTELAAKASRASVVKRRVRRA